MLRSTEDLTRRTMPIPRNKDLNQIMREMGEPVYYTPTDLYPVLMNGGRHDIVLINPKFEV